MDVVLALLALLVALAALVVALRGARSTQPEPGADLPADAAGLRGEVAALRAEARGALRHLAVVRYDAFEEMGGRLSWSLALLDDTGDGVVLTSIRGRNEARTYAKSVSGWSSEQELSPEESEAVAHARLART
ncbi:DUF4446 family protein [Nocardioides sp. zg-536]|uniref:DUF4446 family protein n=1 Tax=Nocardioides faecalis TaxID=2803858 RepID=A0A939BRJ5_9ACTN|nr:DUF4446 family protein [Nocardioides faecalis]MBM9458694.1 DUF4446 family protein [Nocardioides faecalis]MBS4753028.1 DUF4446 family protein [Nocardioides faecalis]QVI58684.1 DUF4446 family protein [Nocardioides faecalis]